MLDQLSPVAPARVRAVLLPIGQIKRARFLGFVERLQAEHAVQLGDINADGRPDRSKENRKLPFPSWPLLTASSHVLTTRISPWRDTLRPHNTLPATLACLPVTFRNLP